MQTKTKQQPMRCIKAPDKQPRQPRQALTSDEGHKMLALQNQRADLTCTLAQAAQLLDLPEADVETMLRFSGFLVNDGIVS